MITETQDDLMVINKDLSSIYLKISIETNDLFDEKEESIFLIENISKIFDNKYGKHIESKFIIENPNQFNNDFINLIKLCVNTKQYKKVSKIFTELCDYYNLPYNKVFCILHEKIQNLIKSDFVKMIGKDKYKKLKNKYIAQEDSVNKILTIFDISKNDKL